MNVGKRHDVERNATSEGKRESSGPSVCSVLPRFVRAICIYSCCYHQESISILLSLFGHGDSLPLLIAVEAAFAIYDVKIKGDG